jgi:hypothetical protein
VSPVKLKQGVGEAVVTVLNLLLDRTMKHTRMVLKRPNFKGCDSQVDESEFLELEDDEAKILIDSVEDTEEGGMQEVIESPTKTNEDDEDQNAVIESNIDPHEWKIECERVGPLLKVKDVDKEKGWRTHIDGVLKYKA